MHTPFPPANTCNLRHRSPCQVESLTAELVQVQERAVDRGELEAAHAARAEAESRAAGLVAEREGVAREVEGMQAALLRLQAEAAGEAGARTRLSRLRATLESVRGEKAQLEGQLTHAEAKVAELRDRLEQKEVRRLQRREVGQGCEGGESSVDAHAATAHAHWCANSRQPEHNARTSCISSLLRCSSFHLPQAALRKVQSRCRALEGELAESLKQQREHKPGSQANAAGQDVPAPGLQARCDALTAELQAAKQQQLETAAAAAAGAAECGQLRHQVQRLERQLAEAAATSAATATSSPGAGSSQAAAQSEAAVADAAEAGAGAAAEQSAAAGLQQQLADTAAQLEQLEFERDELRVKLEESECQVAALTAAAVAAKQEQQQQQQEQVATAGALAGKPAVQDARSEGSEGSEPGWSLAAGPAAGVAEAAALQAACEREDQLREEAQQLTQHAQQLEAQVVALQGELAAVRAGAGGAAVADAAAAELRRQLAERSQEVADLSTLSIKADATVQQSMAQLRRWVETMDGRRQATEAARHQG